MKRLALVLLQFLAGSCSAQAQSFDPHDPHSPLQLVRAIALPNVKGRIDHMALDDEHHHLFVAEYGNGSLDEIDLASGKVVGRISGLHEPQGVAWLPNQQEIAVASGDGFVSFYRSADRQLVATVRLGDDADDVRVDSRNGNLVVGYGAGALAVIGPATHQVIRRITLSAHPEAFELLGTKVFVNVPDAHEIVIGDLDQGRVIATVSTGLHFGNFPMASDTAATRIAVAYRVPGTLSVLDAASGAETYSVPVCQDADDLYFHASSVIIVCGSGMVQLVKDAAPHDSVRVFTARGARTALFDAVQNRLLVAVPAGLGPAAIWELSFR